MRKLSFAGVIVFLTVNLLVFLTGCGIHQEIKKESINKITLEDFNINYNGIVINDIVPFKELAKKFGIVLGKKWEENENVDTKAVGSGWALYDVFYPSRKNCDIVIRYIINEKKKIEYIVSVEIYKKAKTFRNIRVGQKEREVTKAYGDKVKSEFNSEDTDSFIYVLSSELQKNKYEDKMIFIVLDRKTTSIIRIGINYNENKMFEESEFGSLD